MRAAIIQTVQVTTVADGHVAYTVEQKKKERKFKYILTA